MIPPRSYIFPYIHIIFWIHRCYRDNDMIMYIGANRVHIQHLLFYVEPWPFSPEIIQRVLKWLKWRNAWRARTVTRLTGIITLSASSARLALINSKFVPLSVLGSPTVIYIYNIIWKLPSDPTINENCLMCVGKELYIYIYTYIHILYIQLYIIVYIHIYIYYIYNYT